MSQAPKFVKVEDLPKPFNSWQAIQSVSHVEQSDLAKLKEREAAIVINHLQNLLNMAQKQEAYVVSNIGELTEKKRELEKDLEVITSLKDQKSRTIKFQLADSLFADATVDALQSVNIWLSNTLMVEYPLEEAIDMLTIRQNEVSQKEMSIASQRKALKKIITTIQVSNSIFI